MNYIFFVINLKMMNQYGTVGGYPNPNAPQDNNEEKKKEENQQGKMNNVINLIRSTNEYATRTTTNASSTWSFRSNTKTR